MNRILFTVYSLLLFSTVFNSCQKDETKPLDSKVSVQTIPIDENSAFNMKNFLHSYEQLFSPSSREAWAYEHVLNEKGLATETYHNLKIHGKFGEKANISQHHYSENGILTHSTKTSYTYSRKEELTFEYKYDKEGYIKSYILKTDGTEVEHVDLTYNDKKQLTKQKATYKYSDNKETIETSFTYLENGKVAKWIFGDGNYMEFSYSGSTMIGFKQYDNGELTKTETWELDSQNRVTEMVSNSKTLIAVSYNDESLVLKQFGFNGELRYQKTIKSQMRRHTYKRYMYSSNQFEYCLEYKYDENLLTKKNTYYSGSISELQLEGYLVVDERHPNLNNEKTKASFYNHNNEKLYYIEYDVETYGENGTQITQKWYKADGTPTKSYDVNEKWVLRLAISTSK